MSEGVTYLSSVQYNALNQPKQYTLGSGTTALVSHTYYGPDATGWPYGGLKTIQLQQGSNPMLVNRDMGYDYAGNVISINDLVNSENISYGYDHVDRLISAGSPLNESYVYNEIGNMTSKGGATLYYNDTAHKHAVTSYNGVSYSYDANGCMTTRGSQSIKYNPENMPVRVSASGTICRFAYDGDNVRRKRLDSNGTIHYLGAFERNLGNGLDATRVDTKYYIALGKTIALRKAGALYYVGTGHLGSTIRVTDASFNAVEQMRYKPYGKSRDAGTNLKTDHKFTSQIEDAIVGLYWYNSRAFDPIIGRFVAPDTIVPEPKNPQALNRYTYTLNNPLKYVDPSGHEPLGSKWVDDFRKAHGKDPTDDDRIDRLNSILLSNGGTWDDDDWRRYTQAKQSGALDPQAVLKGTSGTLDQRLALASALVTLATSGPVGGWIYDDYIRKGGTVQFGGGPFRQGGTAIGYNGAVYLDDSWQDWPTEILASYMAHESYHAQMPLIRYPYTRGEEVQAFTREAAAWGELRVKYDGPRTPLYYQRETILIYSGRPEGLKYYVDTNPFYNRPPYVP